MSFLQQALKLAELGFHIFPIIEGTKEPLIKTYTPRASRDPKTLQDFWTDPILDIELGYNIGIATSKFGDGEALLAVDVDNKNGKDGDGVLLQLELEGCELPPTFTQFTPTGGRHLIYRVKKAVKQGTGVLGDGVDIRSRGGYLVGAGSSVKAGVYTADFRDIAYAPEWLISRCGVQRDKQPRGESKTLPVNKDLATDRAIFYLENEAPLAIENEGGDQTTYQVAARVKDFGLSVTNCFNLMAQHWNDRCSPPWSIDDLLVKIQNAYRYGLKPAGSDAPETQFEKIEDDKLSAEEERRHPFTELNKEFAFALAGGGSHILWETKDSKGNFKLEHLNIMAFHQMLAARMLTLGDGKTKPLSELWMRSPERRSYDGICFMPGRQAPPRFYNLWRGFAIEPAAVYTPNKSVDMFLDHALKNVCNGDHNLFNWLIGYFAHLVQKPWEKPLVALVFRGQKGVGKNALIRVMGAILGNHYLLTSNRRYLIGNFNGHLENLLMFVLDEAFWSGDKQAEGTIKDLITGDTHNIEHKGKESYAVENCTRVVIIGNENWLVPASEDERRYAVFDVGDGRKQDRSYFQTMREGMEHGGYAQLLRYLLDFDLSKTEVNAAPSTQGLLDQKINSLDTFYQWWLDCLTEGRLSHSDFGNQWPDVVEKDRLRSAFNYYRRNRGITTRMPDSISLGRLLKRCVPTVETTKKREGNETHHAYKLPELLSCRESWDKFIGHTSNWDT